MELTNERGLGADDTEAIRQLRLADTFFNHSVSCLVILDREFNFVRVNEAYARACRRDISEFAGRNHFDLFPSDAKPIFDDVVRTKRPFVTFTRAFEFADQPERGITYWDWTLVPVLDKQGEIEFLVFSLVEVTERRRAQEALLVASLVYQHSSEAMIVTDAAGLIISVNDAFTQLTGFTAEEAKGKNPKLLQSGRQTPEFYQAMWEALNTTGHWQGELWDKGKRGEAIAARLTINSVFDDDGKVTRRVALFADITEKKKAENLIWEQANFDALTKLPNRYMFHDKLRQQLALANRSGNGIVVLLIDLDQFKEVNDSLGHDKGDILLIEVTRRISECFGTAVTIARLGGDEFAVLLTRPDELAAVDAGARQIIARLAEPFRLNVETVFISASIGIASYPTDGTEIEDLLRHADQAMYAAKAAGRNRYCRFTSALQEAAQVRLRLTNDLRGAMARNEFEVYYQPIVKLATATIDKAEALIRWAHPTRGMVSPVEFIPLAEASGMILEIGEWVFKQAAATAKNLREMGLAEFAISVNVSPVQFRNDAGLNQTWLKHLSSLGLPAQSIVVEITEGLLLDLTTEVKGNLLAFRDAGIQLSLDDFGTGYSSLAYLKTFDIDYLKIDRAFVKGLQPGSNDLALCEAIIVMAHKLGLEVIAEGVETVTQRDLLAVAGCDYAQGFLYSKPVPETQFEALVL